MRTIPFTMWLQAALAVGVAFATPSCSGPPEPGRTEGTEPGDCEDGADNDADGLFDCSDPGCTGAPVCASLDGGMDAAAPDAGSGADAGSDGGADTDAAIACDVDGDGHLAVACGGGDCDDDNAARNPGAPEVCDGLDNNCNDLLDFPGEDDDGDGFADCVDLPMGIRDCNDDDTGVHPGAAELCDGVDQDCDGTTSGEDEDGDGFLAIGAMCTGGVWGAFPRSDCNDLSAAVHPSATEVCDMAAVDEDCDGMANPASLCECWNGQTRPCSLSGPCAAGIDTCGGGAWGPCSISPITEACNNVDDDCDGTVDGSAADPWCNDPVRALPNATASCQTGGVCRVVSCTSPYLDCDGVDTTGCEVDALRSSQHCGACGSVCPFWCESGCDNAIQVSAGGSHTCAVRSSGRVACWGLNSKGQLGDGTMIDRAIPVAVFGLTDAVMVSAGNEHTCAVRSTGQVVCWGDNLGGKLGDGTGTRRTTPVAVTGLTDGVTVSAGTNHSCAVRSTGQVVCWGRESYSGLTDAVQVSAGGTHTCALRSAGQVVCWGRNTYGQLGDGTTSTRTTPVAVSGLTDAIRLSAGSLHTCALRSAGQVVCWGSGVGGQLGDGTLLDRTSPVSVSGLTNAVEVAAGGAFTCASRSSGQAVCWGNNSYGMLGDGTTMNRTTPVNVTGLADAVQLSGSGGGAHACAVRPTGQVVCWGYNFDGELGDGVADHGIVCDPFDCSTTPVVVVPP